MFHRKIIDNDECLFKLMDAEHHTILGKYKETFNFTNGCFDIFHIGHSYNFYHIKNLYSGSLVVFVNSDESVRKWKGEGKPLFPFEERAYMVASHEAVSYVVKLKDDNMTKVLEKFKPKRWFKGGDYTIDTIVKEEREVAERNNIQICFAPKLEGYSTTNKINIIKGIKND